MLNIRSYGNAPYRVAVVHGGPGDRGGVAAIARELSTGCGTLEPLQTGLSVTSQVEELRDVIREHGAPPVVLVGHSWGAWLTFITAARYPELVSRLILVGCGPFETKYLGQIGERRFSRLTPAEQADYRRLLADLENPATADKDSLMAQLGALVEKADNFDLLPEPTHSDDEPGAGDMYQAVWPEAAAMRKSGELLELGRLIRCPVLAIQGDVDPHPVAGVAEPLSQIVQDFRLTELRRCGHSPWREKHARDELYRLLRQEIAAATQQ